MSVRLYNEELKEKYLSERFDNEETKTTVRHIFGKAELIEDILQKDLYNFSIKEIEKVIQNANPYSLIVAKSYARIISGYISWSIKPMGLRENNINPIKGVDDDWFEKLIDKTKKVHWSKQELFTDIIEKLDNPQDQAMLSLIFDGVLGRGFSELKNITYSDVDFLNNKVKVQRNKEEKYIDVSEETVKYILLSFETDTYKQRNNDTGEIVYKKFLSSDYLFKNLESPRGREGTPVSIQIFYNRIQSIRDQFGLDMLTPNGIKQSGMIWGLVSIALDKINSGEKPILGYDEFAIIGEKYNASMINQNGFSYYNTHLMREYIRETTIKELYDLDVELKMR